MSHALPQPQFIEYDPKVMEEQCFAKWEELTEGLRPLTPGQAEYAFVKLIAYRDSLRRLGINEASKQNLLRFAVFPMIDYIGELVGVERLDAQPAKTTLRITLPSVSGVNQLVPSGTRRKSNDGRVIFATTKDLVIVAGELTGDVEAVCQTAGEQGNGYVGGQIGKEVDSLPLSATAANITTSSGGAPRELDSRLLDRILLAPDAFSTAGPEEAYRFHALSASTQVSDVAVLSIDDDPSLEVGEILIVVLATDGVPDTELLDLVEAACNPEKVRPIGDEPTAEACVEVNWTLDVGLVLYADADGAEALSAATEAAEAYAAAKRNKLGTAPVEGQIIAACKEHGVYDVLVNSPAAPVSVGVDEWANCTSVTVAIDSYVAEKMGGEP